MSARDAWIGTTSARGNVNSKRRQPRGVYIQRAEVINFVHANMKIFLNNTLHLK